MLVLCLPCPSECLSSSCSSRASLQNHTVCTCVCMVHVSGHNALCSRYVGALPTELPRQLRWLIQAQGKAKEDKQGIIRKVCI